MKEQCTVELQKIYDDPHISPLLQEVCEYYASHNDYENGTYQEEIEPREIVEPVYMLFLLQRRESVLDELQYISRHYPNLFSEVSELYNLILVNMVIRPLEEDTAGRLSHALDDRLSPEQLLNKIEELTDRYDDLSEALDRFYSFIH